AQPGRVDPPTTSTMSAPAWNSARPCPTAATLSACRPPSENESGVTLSTPMTHVLSPRTASPPRRVSRYGRLEPRASIAPPYALVGAGGRGGAAPALRRRFRRRHRRRQDPSRA